MLLGMLGWGEIMRPTSRLKLVVLGFAIRNASCDLQNDDKELRSFLLYCFKLASAGAIVTKKPPMRY